MPQKELTLEQVYWKPVQEVVSSPTTPFVLTRPAQSEVPTQLLSVKSLFKDFEHVIRKRTTEKSLYPNPMCFKHTKECFEHQIIPFFGSFVYNF